MGAAGLRERLRKPSPWLVPRLDPPADGRVDCNTPSRVAVCGEWEGRARWPGEGIFPGAKEIAQTLPVARASPRPSRRRESGLQTTLLQAEGWIATKAEQLVPFGFIAGGWQFLESCQVGY